MKSTGIVRKMDPLGRVTIPMELRKTLGIKTQDAVEYFVDGEQIIITKYTPGCHECGKVDVPLKGKRIKLCKGCWDIEIQALRDSYKS
jgi:transcriptional pleiotropic regulator of transition state genes